MISIDVKGGFQKHKCLQVNNVRVIPVCVINEVIRNIHKSQMSSKSRLFCHFVDKTWFTVTLVIYFRNNFVFSRRNKYEKLFWSQSIIWVLYFCDTISVFTIHLKRDYFVPIVNFCAFCPLFSMNSLKIKSKLRNVHNELCTYFYFHLTT